MTVKTKLLFILIGDDRTGKTTLQKLLIEKLCNHSYDRLPVNIEFDITHPEIKRKYHRISFGNRSYQEKKGDYHTVDEYFSNHFKNSDIAFISSHLTPNDIQEMITNGRRRFYNVNGVFLSNSIETNNNLNADISELDWDERFLIENPLIENNRIDNQLDIIAENFVDLIINRTKIS